MFSERTILNTFLAVRIISFLIGSAFSFKAVISGAIKEELLLVSAICSIRLTA